MGQGCLSKEPECEHRLPGDLGAVEVHTLSNYVRLLGASASGFEIP